MSTARAPPVVFKLQVSAAARASTAHSTYVRRDFQAALQCFMMYDAELNTGLQENNPEKVSTAVAAKEGEPEVVAVSDATLGVRLSAGAYRDQMRVNITVRLFVMRCWCCITGTRDQPSA